ncbi:MAG: dTMP kinase [Pseudomonadota bacterium]
MTLGKFITLEGGEGVGKSTNLAFAERFLREHGKTVITTREPGGTALGEEIRNLLLAHRKETISENAELLLMFAARAQHIEEVILPAIERGIWVLSDRFTDASYAYQGGGRQITENRIAVLENWLQGTLVPDMTILLDAPIEVGISRARGRGDLDRFESEANNFFQRVRSKYLELAERNPERIKVVDATLPLEAVQNTIAGYLGRLLPGP